MTADGPLNSPFDPFTVWTLTAGFSLEVKWFDSRGSRRKRQAAGQYREAGGRTIPVLVLERKSVFASFGRSGELSRDLKLHILSALGLVFLIRIAVTIGALIVVGVIPQQIVQHVLSTLISIVVYPLVGITDALLYYDARIRREGFDIEMMAGATAPPAAAVG